MKNKYGEYGKKSKHTNSQKPIWVKWTNGQGKTRIGDLKLIGEEFCEVVANDVTYSVKSELIEGG